MSNLLDALLAQIQNLVRSGNYRLSAHAEREREADHITIAELKETILSGDAAIIEDYPEDTRGHSCLVCGSTETGSQIHTVCSALGSKLLVVITVYRPDPSQWEQGRKRRIT